MGGRGRVFQHVTQRPGKGPAWAGAEMQCRPQGAPSGPRLFLQLCSDWPFSGLSDFTAGGGRNFLTHPKSRHPLPGNSPPHPLGPYPAQQMQITLKAEVPLAGDLALEDGVQRLMPPWGDPGNTHWANSCLGSERRCSWAGKGGRGGAFRDSPSCCVFSVASTPLAAVCPRPIRSVEHEPDNCLQSSDLRWRHQAIVVTPRHAPNKSTPHRSDHAPISPIQLPGLATPL